ncbi:hypothetical protein Nepgr_018562 [Nepenthes gracilis]|uniref:60S ribosomal protein L7a n=1 Tax=Nepenthes gracilis TaxID=150966 RepID=A0AAD3STV7_NEPGR|nr:hypothetical protein Nepgr_018562 [Nepenthes gracilis]
MEIPYCIVKGKARLGAIVHKKTAAVSCLTTVKNEDKLEFSKILEAIKANFNDKYEEDRKKWGGGIMGSKSQAKTRRRSFLRKRLHRGWHKGIKNVEDTIEGSRTLEMNEDNDDDA